MKDRHWEHFAHGADIGIRGSGPTKEAAFEEAARALTAVVTEPGLVAASRTVGLTCAAPDDDILLLDWLNGLIYEMAARRMLFSDFHVHISGHDLNATARGEPVDPDRHAPAVEVKGATLTELRVGRNGGGWVAQCVVDV